MAPANFTEPVPKEQKANTLPEGWQEAEVRNRQGQQQVISPEINAGKSSIAKE